MQSESIMVKRHFLFALLIACGLVATENCFGQQATGTDVLLKKFLQKYWSDPAGNDMTAEYVAATVHLHGDTRKTFVVYVAGQTMCGSGGCRLLVLEPKGASFKEIGSMTITRPPIRVLSSVTNGMHDIGVWVQGGGIQPGYEAVLPFNGTSYPSNPSVSPARPSIGMAAGTIAISAESAGKPLYK